MIYRICVDLSFYKTLVPDELHRTMRPVPSFIPFFLLPFLLLLFRLHVLLTACSLLVLCRAVVGRVDNTCCSRSPSRSSYSFSSSSSSTSLLADARTPTGANSEINARVDGVHRRRRRWRRSLQLVWRSINICFRNFFLSNLKQHHVSCRWEVAMVWPDGAGLDIITIFAHDYCGRNHLIGIAPCILLLRHIAQVLWMHLLWKKSVVTSTFFRSSTSSESFHLPRNTVHALDRYISTVPSPLTDYATCANLTYNCISFDLVTLNTDRSFDNPGKCVSVIYQVNYFRISLEKQNPRRNLTMKIIHYFLRKMFRY